MTNRRNMAYIQIRGVDHYYEWIGRKREGDSKPVMVFIHGWGGSARYWESTALAIADSFDCLLYDLRGFGRSRLPQTPTGLDYEMETYADDLAILLDSLGLQRVYINAHSMGSSMATLFVNRYPELVEKVILSCSGVFEYDEREFAAFHKWGSKVVKFRPSWLTLFPFMDKLFIARFLHRPIGSAASKAFLEDYLMADEEAVLGTLFTSVSKKTTEVMPKEFALLQMPVLLVSGQYDKIIPATGARKAAALNKRVKFVEIPQTGHFPMLEDSDSYLQQVREFLGINSRSPELGMTLG